MPMSKTRRIRGLPRRNSVFTPSMIFQRERIEDDTTLLFSKRAMLYQNILEYLFQEKPDGKVRLWDLAKWLLGLKNGVVAKAYDNIGRRSASWKIRSFEGGLKEYVEDLISAELMLIRSEEPSRRYSKQQIKIYGYTEFGKITALLIKYLDNKQSKDRAILAEQIVEILQCYFGNYSSHLGTYFSKMLQYLKEERRALNLAQSLLQHLRNPDLRMLEVVKAAISAQFMNLNDSRAFRDTLGSMPSEEQRVIKMHFKIIIEKAYAELPPPKEWELLWVHNAGNPEKVTLFGLCSACKHSYPITVDFYIVFNRGENITGPCKACGSPNSFTVGLEIAKKIVKG